MGNALFSLIVLSDQVKCKYFTMSHMATVLVAKPNDMSFQVSLCLIENVIKVIIVERTEVPIVGRFVVHKARVRFQLGTLMFRLAMLAVSVGTVCFTSRGAGLALSEFFQEIADFLGNVDFMSFEFGEAFPFHFFVHFMETVLHFLYGAGCHHEQSTVVC